MKSTQKILIIFMITLTLAHISLPPNSESTSLIQVADKGGGFGSSCC